MAVSATTSPPALLEQLHVRVFTIHRTVIDEWWTQDERFSSYWRLYVNNRHGASVRVGEEVYALPAGRVHLIPAWVRFIGQLSRAVRHYYIHFEVVGLPATVVRELFTRPYMLPADPCVTALARQWMADMDQRYVTQDDDSDARRLAAHAIFPGPAHLEVLGRAKSLVFLALSQLLGTLSPEQHAQCCRHLLGQHALMPALDYIENHLGEGLRNTQLAELCGVSADHFIRLFRQHAGQTPAQYILDRRVSTAAQKLVFTGEKIDTIAAGTGFRDRFHFSRVFAARMGLPPAAYRRTARV